MENEFNQQEYIQQYNKENYIRFSVDLRKEYIDRIDKITKQHKISRAEFVRQSIANFEKEEREKQ